MLLVTLGLQFACIDLSLPSPVRRSSDPLREEGLVGAAAGGTPARAVDSAAAEPERGEGGPLLGETPPTPSALAVASAAPPGADREADATTPSETAPVPRCAARQSGA